MHEMSLKEEEGGLAKVGDFSRVQLRGPQAGGEAQVVSSCNKKRGSSLARLPDDVLHYMLISFLLIKDVLRLDSAWTVRSEREKCWLPVLHKFFGRSPVLFETSKCEFVVSDLLFVRMSRAWINARSLLLARVIAPSEHRLSVELDRLTQMNFASFSSFKQDLAAVSSWLRANNLPVPKHTLDVIFTGNEMTATRALRRILAIKENAPIQEAIDVGVVPRFVEFLHRSDNPVLQFEAAWALTNIASGFSEHTQCVIDAGAVPIFVKLLASPHQDVCDQAVWALGNVSGDSVSSRDVVLQHGALPALMELGSTFSDVTRLFLIRQVMWTLSNLCRGKPAPPLDLLSPALPLLTRQMYINDTETVTHACWALSYLSDGPNDRIEAVLQAGVARRLVELLQNETTALTPALRTVGNIATGNDVQTQRIIDLNVLPALLKLLDNSKKHVRKEAAWVVSNITAGTRDQIQAVIDTGLVPKLIELLQAAEFKIQKAAALAVSNATSGGNVDQVLHLVQEGAIPPMCHLLDSHDDEVVTVVLDGLDNIFNKLPSDALQEALHVFQQCEGDKMIEILRNHQTAAISNRAAAIVRRSLRTPERRLRE